MAAAQNDADPEPGHPGHPGGELSYRSHMQQLQQQQQQQQLNNMSSSNMSSSNNNLSIPSYREDGGGAMGGLTEAELGPLPPNWEKAYTERGEVYFIE